MKSAVEKLSPTRVKLTVEVPFEELDRASTPPTSRSPGRSRSRGSARERFRRGSSTSASAAARCSSRRSTRAPRASTARPSRRTKSARSASPRSRSPRSPTLRGRRAATSPPRSTSAPSSSCPTTRASRSRSTTSRSPRSTSTSASRPCASASAPSSASTGRCRAATSSPSTCPPRSTASEVDSVSGVSYEIGAGAHAAGPGRGDHRACSAGESSHVHATLAGGEHKRPGSRRHASPSQSSRSASSPSSTTSSPSWPASSTPSKSCVPTAERRRTSSAQQVCRPATAARKARSTPSTSRCRSGIVEAEVHRQLEGEDRLEDDEDRAEVEADRERHNALSRPASFSTSRLPGEPDREPRRADPVRRRAGPEHGIAPDQFFQASCRPTSSSMVTRGRAGQGTRPVVSKAKITDESGNTIDLRPGRHGDHHGRLRG